MATATDVLTAVREELVDLALIRKPGDTNAPALPPAFIEPAGGAPAPGERTAPENDDSLMVTLTAPNELGEVAFDTYRRRVQIDVRFRSKTTRGLMRARTLAAAIDAALVNRPDYGFGYVLAEGTPAAVFVLQASIWAGLGTISTTLEGADHRAAYIVEVHR